MSRALYITFLGLTHCIEARAKMPSVLELPIAQFKNESHRSTNVQTTCIQNDHHGHDQTLSLLFTYYINSLKYPVH